MTGAVSIFDLISTTRRITTYDIENNDYILRVKSLSIFDEMSWSAVGEFIKAISPIFTAIAACFGAYIGWKGLEKWRTESLGKKRTEVAIATLTDFYFMEQVITEARSPLVLAHEMSSKEGLPDRIATNPAFAHEARLLQHDEFFSRFRARKHEFAAVFGKDHSNLFDQIWRVRIQINHAVEHLVRLPKNGVHNDFDNEMLAVTRYINQDTDDITNQIRNIVLQIEAICRPEIDGNYNK